MTKITPCQISCLVEGRVLTRPSVSEQKSLDGRFLTPLNHNHRAKQYLAEALLFGRKISASIVLPDPRDRDDDDEAAPISWAAFADPEEDAKMHRVHDRLAKEINKLVPQLSTHEQLRLHQLLQE